MTQPNGPSLSALKLYAESKGGNNDALDAQAQDVAFVILLDVESVEPVPVRVGTLKYAQRKSATVWHLSTEVTSFDLRVSES